MPTLYVRISHCVVVVKEQFAQECSIFPDSDSKARAFDKVVYLSTLFTTTKFLLAKLKKVRQRDLTSSKNTDTCCNRKEYTVF